MTAVPMYLNATSGNDGLHSPGAGAGGGAFATGLGFFVNVPGAPGSTTCLLDWNLGSGQYYRISLKTDLTVLVEAHIVWSQDTSGSLTTSTSLVANQWWWVTATQASDGYNTHLGWIVGLWGPSGQAYSGWFRTNPNCGYPTTTLSGVLGWGAVQTSAYAGFPNDSTHLMSKLYVQYRECNTWITPPSSDLSGGTVDMLCRDAVGAVSGTLADSSGNGYNMSPGPQGATVYAVGPYA
jgi:hypothetical protein